MGTELNIQLKQNTEYLDAANKYEICLEVVASSSFPKVNALNFISFNKFRN